MEQVSLWVSRTRKLSIDSQRMFEGIRELRFPDGASLSSLATVDAEGNRKFPYRSNVRLTHGQPGVPGRRWIAEVGLRQDDPEQNLLCSVVLKTDEISAKVNHPIQVTRPLVVELLVSKCEPTESLPGRQVVSLTEASASQFLEQVHQIGRRYPIVEVSCDSNGKYPVLPERLRSLLVGLAQVVDIPISADTYRLEEIIGRRFIAFGGAINIISPYRSTEYGGFCRTTLLLPEKLEEWAEAGIAVDSEVLSLVTHQTNLPNFWRHTTHENVREAILKFKLAEAASAAGGSEITAVYEELLQEAAEQIALKNSELEASRAGFDQQEANIDQLSSEIESLRYRLGIFQSQPKEAMNGIGLSETQLLALRASVCSTPLLTQSLTVVASLYPERLIILDTAYSSADDSDRSGFQHGKKALELLTSLAGPYWEALMDGKGDQQASHFFGKNGFAAKEAETLSKEGRRRRTFKYKDEDVLMEKHLKHGVKDSAAETLRIHFAWDPSDAKIVIGHCGRHLDF